MTNRTMKYMTMTVCTISIIIAVLVTIIEKGISVEDRLIRANQNKTISIINAENARQDRIAAEERSKEQVVLAQTQEECQAVREVIRAAKDKQIAILKSQQELAIAADTKLTAELKIKTMIMIKKATNDSKNGNLAK